MWNFYHFYDLLKYLCVLRLKFELVSNAAKVEKVSHEQSNAVYEKDYYVVVMDDFNKVLFNHAFNST